MTNKEYLICRACLFRFVGKADDPRTVCPGCGLTARKGLAEGLAAIERAVHDCDCMCETCRELP